MISLGKIVKVRGIGGEVVVNPSLDSSLHDIKEGETFLLKSEKYQKPIKIEYLKRIKGFLILKFVNIMRQ